MSNVAAKLAQARQQFEAGRADQARATLLMALKRNPGNPDLSNAMALVLGATGQHEQAIFHAQRAIAARPGSAAPLVNLGNSLGILGRNEEAHAAFTQALEISPTSADARLGLANIHRRRAEYLAAARVLEQGLADHPADSALASLYAAVLPHRARADKAALVAARALQAEPGNAELAIGLANSYNYIPDVPPQEVLRAHQHFGRLVQASVPRLPAAEVDMAPERPLRIGILSHDLRRHSVAFFLEPILQHLDKDAFHIFCYSTAGREDDFSARLRTLAQWRAVADFDDRRLAEQIRADNIDVLIETSGLTRGHRLPVMAMKPAPLQATFIGYPNTTGLSAIDLRLVDALTDPEDADQFCTERLVRLDSCFLCYQPPHEAPEVTLRTLDLGSPVFGSFCALQKLNQQVIETWAALLAEVPCSRLMLKSLDFREPELRQEIKTRFASVGVEESRLEFLPPADSLVDHLAAYARMDVALDTFPYAGTTTTFEALWMGVPVITLSGRSHASRVGASILTNLGQPDHIASSKEQYIQLAASLARDGEALDRFRRELRPRLASSLLCDGPAYAQRLAAALRSAWREACNQKDKPS